MPSWLWNITIGLFVPEPKFVTVLADQDIERGRQVLFSCVANTNKVTETWTKDREPLPCKQGKHHTEKRYKTYKLKIENVEEDDEGTYTLTLSNISGSVSCSACLTLALKEWRKIPKIQNDTLQILKNYPICNEDVKELRFLLHGPVGAGKSTVINTIKTIFEKRQFINCLAASESTTSHTQDYQKYTVGKFAFFDVMGLEEGELDGVRTDDLIKALKGHIKSGYEFKLDSPISEDDQEYYISTPSLAEKIHCLVSVLPTDKISLINNEVISKMRTIRKEANKLGIPQVVFLTKVDKACSVTKADLKKIYQSRKIKEKMQECSCRLTVPMNCIFPVKNYHEETQLNEDINNLMLDAVMQISHWANDYVRKCSENLKYIE